MKFEKFIDEYKGIKAPETLKERISASAQKNPRHTRVTVRVLAAAAMLVLVFTAAIVWKSAPFHPESPGAGAYIAYNGQSVDDPVAVSVDNPSDINYLTALYHGGIMLDVHVTGGTSVSVSSGTLVHVDAGAVPTFTGNLVAISGEAGIGDAPTYTEDRIVLSGEKALYTLYWQADFSKASVNSPFVLTLQDAQGSVSYSLIGSDGQITLRKDSKN